MKLHKSNFSCPILIFIFVFIRNSTQSELKRNYLFNFNWRFHKGGALGEEEPSFDDSLWRAVDLPDDRIIVDLPGANSPLNIDAFSRENCP